MTSAVLANNSKSYRGDPGPMFRIAVPSIGFGRWKNNHTEIDDRDVRAEFQEHFDCDLKAYGNMDPNLTEEERAQVAQMQVIRAALLAA